MMPAVETYSIDQSFLNLGEFNGREVETLARDLRECVHRWVGIPTCVGIAPTKTLAKVANFIAKKRPQYRGVCDLRSSRGAGGAAAHGAGRGSLGYRRGVGGKAREARNPNGGGSRGTRPGLCAGSDDSDGWPHGLRAARDVLHAFGPGGANGKGIAVTRSFGAPVMSWQEMREAIASYVTRAAEKMRRYKVAAANIFVFMHTSTFNDAPSYSNGASARFAETTNNTGEMVSLAVRLGERLWRDGFRYSKSGVMITDLLPEMVRQPALWAELDRDRRLRFMDRLNATLGRDIVRILGAGLKDAAWKLRAEHRSPGWTRRWEELPRATAR